MIVAPTAKICCHPTVKTSAYMAIHLHFCVLLTTSVCATLIRVCIYLAKWLFIQDTDLGEINVHTTNRNNSVCASIS